MPPVRKFPAAALAGAVLALVAPDPAAAAYLTTAYENRLETWVGQGNLTFTNIFTSAAGDGKTSADFHAAADGRGRTITLIKIAGGTYNGQIIGGYNPQSWNTSNSWNTTTADANRAAFIFNLTTDVRLRQQLSTENPNYPNYGSYQTFNASYVGPTFGGGYDITADNSLSSGSARQFSYGAPGNVNGYYGQNVFGLGAYTLFNIAGIEVYEVSSAPLEAVPAPPGLVLGLVGAVTLLPAGWRRRRAAARA